MSALDSAAYRSFLERDLAVLDRIADGDLGAAVPSCPGWDLGRLIGHLGAVHRMVLGVLPEGLLQPADPATLQRAPKDDLPGLRAYWHDGATRLRAALADAPDDRPCWNFLGVEPVAAFWQRRMAQEHAVHRWDAQLALGVTPDQIDPSLAVDGIDEWFDFANVRILPNREGFTLPGTVHLHATDAEGEWMIRAEDGRLVVERSHGKGDAACRGTASDLLLGLWGRADLAGGASFERFGDETVLRALTTIGGA